MIDQPRRLLIPLLETFNLRADLFGCMGNRLSL